MKTWVSFYSLFPIGFLNSQTDNSERKAALVKIEFDDGSIGYADFHYPEMFEDCSLFESLRLMRSQQGLDSFFVIKEMARKTSLFNQQENNLEKIKNHYLIRDIQNFSPTDFLFLETNGFDRFKIKMGRSLKKETIALREISKNCSSQTKFRLDFNASIKKPEFKIWLKKNSDLLSKIDFIEDPVKYEASFWEYVEREYPLRLALDLEADPIKLERPRGFSVLVVKPARQSAELIIDKYKDFDIDFVYTHFMDHPFGQACAINSAMKVKAQLGGRLLDCGLLSTGIFEETEADACISSEGPYVLPPQLDNLGFKTYFESLKWHPLN